MVVTFDPATRLNVPMMLAGVMVVADAPTGASAICSLFGSTTPFSPQMLVALYQTKSNYIAAYTASLDKAIKGGFILQADRAGLLAQAQQVAFPS